MMIMLRYFLLILLTILKIVFNRGEIFLGDEVTNELQVYTTRSLNLTLL